MFSAKKNLALAVMGLVIGSAVALCPNQCSEHGACGAFDRCSCHRNFLGADCSRRVCPYTKAWADVIDSSVTGRTGHYYAECGNKGTCNTDTGRCDCVDGFEGKGCRRMSCPNDCSGHGVCNLMSEVNSYSLWDASKIQVCVCDPGYEGLDCSKRMCMKGDDPMSVFDASGAQTQVNEVQKVVMTTTGTVTAGGAFTLTYTDWRGAAWTTKAIEYDTLSAISVAEALEALPNHAIPTVTVTMISGVPDGDNDGKGFMVTFSDPANSGDQPALVLNTDGCTTNGCQPVYGGVAASGTKTYAVTESTAGTEENQVCSGRGLCNAESGLCECVPGYYGVACERQTVIV